MTAPSDRDGEVRLVADRLADIASSVANEASELTRTVRTIGEHARDIAALAAEMDAASAAIEASMQSQLKLLTRAQTLIAGNAPVMAALAGSAETIGAMCLQVRQIADRSRLLGLNARIEAARTSGGGAFAAVAGAMTELAAQTRDATHDIGRRAEGIADNVAAAHQVIAGGVQLVEIEERMITEIAATTGRQRSTASHVAGLTADAVERIDDAAAGIGRVASAASIMGLLARSLTRLDARQNAAIVN